MRLGKIAILLLFISSLSCKNDNFQKVLKTSGNPDLDEVFYKIVLSEFQENRNIAIVDRSMNNEQLNTRTIDTEIETNAIYWTKEIFPLSNFISGDSIIQFKNTNPVKYWKLRESILSGWIEIGTPRFSKERSEVVVYVLFVSPSNFAASRRYMLKLGKKEWVVLEKQLTTIN